MLISLGRHETMPWQAVSCTDFSVLSALLDEQADVNAKDLGGFTALMLPGVHGSYRNLTVILRATSGVKIDVKLLLLLSLLLLFIISIIIFI